MGLEADATLVSNDSCQFRITVHGQAMHGFGAKFDTRLNNQPADQGRHVAKAVIMGRKRCAGGIGLGRGDCPVFVHASPPGRWHLGANDKQQVLCPISRVKTDARQIGRSLCGHRIAKLARLACAAFGTIKVDFPKSGPHIGVNQNAGLFHRRISRFRPPCLRPKVIAAKDDPAALDTNLIGQIMDQLNKPGWLNAGISAELIDLIAGGLDHDTAVKRFGPRQTGAEDIRMRRTDRRDRGPRSGPIAGNDIAQHLNHAPPATQHRPHRVHRWRRPPALSRSGAR